MCRWLVAGIVVLSIALAACSSGRTETILTVDVTNLRQQTAAYDDPNPAAPDDPTADGGVVGESWREAGSD